MTKEEQLDGLHRLRNDIPWLDFSIDIEVSLERKQQYRQVLSEVIKALEQEPKTWSLDDAREDFMHDVYNTLDFLPTNEEANRIIDSFDRVTSSIKQEPVIDKIRTEIKEMTPTYHNPDWSITDLVPMSEVLKLVDKYKTESEE